MTYQQFSEWKNKNKANEVYYILVHEHKHGDDLGLYKTYEAAFRHGVSVMRETAGEWGEDVSGLSDFDLWQSWSEIAGESEFFRVEEVALNV